MIDTNAFFNEMIAESNEEIAKAENLVALLKECLGDNYDRAKKIVGHQVNNEIKLKAIKDLCMSVPDCGVCLLSIGKTCPTKFWNEWTPEEIETAFNIIYGGEAEDAES